MTWILTVPATAYLAVGLMHGGYLLRRRERVLSYARGIAIAALLTHLVVFIAIVAQRLPAIAHGLPASLSPMALLAVLAFLLLQRFREGQALGIVVMPLAFAGTLASALLAPQATSEFSAVLHSPWLLIHVPTSFAAYVAFIVAASAAVFYLGQGWLLKTKHLPDYLEGIPSLDSLEKVVSGAVKLGFILLTVGIVTGAMWSQQFSGSFWAWTPKQGASLATWLIFAAYLHTRVLRGWQGHRSVWLALLGFAAVITTYVGVSAVQQDLHCLP